MTKEPKRRSHLSGLASVTQGLEQKILSKDGLGEESAPSKEESKEVSPTSNQEEEKKPTPPEREEIVEQGLQEYLKFVKISDKMENVSISARQRDIIKAFTTMNGSHITHFIYNVLEAVIQENGLEELYEVLSKMSKKKLKK